MKMEIQACFLRVMLCVISRAVVVTGKFDVSTSQPEVNAVLDSDVLLSCKFTPANSNHGSKYVVATWIFQNHDLVQYKDNTVNPKGRAVLFEKELEKGNASLLLKNVSIRDEGKYICDIYEVTNSKQVSIHLSITAPPNISVLPLLWIMNHSHQLECQIDSFYPEDIFVEWQRDNKPLPLQGHPEQTKNLDGTFTAVSRYFYTPTRNDTGVIFGCLVKHKSLKEPKIVTLPPICDLTLNASPPMLMKDMKQNVSCILNGCLSSQVNMSLVRNGTAIQTIQCKSDRECATEPMLILATEEKVSCEATFNVPGKPLFKKVDLILTDKPQSSVILWVILIPVPIAALVIYFAYKKRCHSGSTPETPLQQVFLKNWFNGECCCHENQNNAHHEQNVNRNLMDNQDNNSAPNGTCAECKGQVHLLQVTSTA